MNVRDASRYSSSDAAPFSYCSLVRIARQPGPLEQPAFHALDQLLRRRVVAERVADVGEDLRARLGQLEVALRVDASHARRRQRRAGDGDAQPALAEQVELPPKPVMSTGQTSVGS
jgi:hypothetical protein